MKELINFSELKNKVLVKIEGLEIGSESIVFYCNDGSIYELFHIQDWCESVDVVDIVGEVSSLIGKPLLMADEVMHIRDKNPKEVDEVPEYQDSFTWTFYKLGTINGYVTIRWYGESNGYYSEDVDFRRIS